MPLTEDLPATMRESMHFAYQIRSATVYGRTLAQEMMILGHRRVQESVCVVGGNGQRQINTVNKYTMLCCFVTIIAVFAAIITATSCFFVSRFLLMLVEG